jgi:hypothetical protein
MVTQEATEDLINWLDQLNKDRAKGLRLPLRKYTEKKCSRCGDPHPNSEEFFYAGRRICIACHKERMLLYYHNRKVKRNAKKGKG